MKIVPVDKNALLNDLNAMCIDDYDYEVYSEVFDMIDQAPALDYAPVVHAHWIEREFGELSCSACGIVQEDDPIKYPFCPMCGAIMDEEVKV